MSDSLKTSPATPSSLSKLTKLTKATSAKKDKGEISEEKSEPEKKLPKPNAEKANVKKSTDKGDSKKSSTISETVNDKKKEQEAEMSPTPIRQNKKQSNEPAVEMSDEKSDTNTRISLRNKNPTIATSSVTTKPRRSMASAKTSTTPQNSQSSKNNDPITMPETKLEMNTSSSLDTSNNALLPKPASTDSGLLSIIKSEPVQISASSTISLTDIEQTNDSIANSTTSSNSSTMKFEDEKAYKAWKKSIMMVMTNIAAHK
jgi:hypothetical protein